MVGVWILSYTNGYKDEYTISAKGKIAIKSKVNRKAFLVGSDNQADFPSSEGWLKANKVYSDVTWEYIRLKKNGTLEILHFGTDFKATYKNLKSYCCVGKGIKGMYLY